jgi:hypothetical protein
MRQDVGSRGSTSLHQLCSLREAASTVMLMAMASHVGYAKPGCCGSISHPGAHARGRCGAGEQLPRWRQARSAPLPVPGKH